MPRRTCTICHEQPAVLKRPKTFQQICKECFYSALEDEVHHTITTHSLFKPGDIVALGASGGKDSTVLAHMMKLLNDRHKYGLKLLLLSVDEGISGYRDDSLETVKRNEKQYSLPLTIISYKELYGWTMDEIVKHIGKRGNCTFCGVFRRQALDRGAEMLGANKVATGHNADDIAETVFLNLMRGHSATVFILPPNGHPTGHPTGHKAPAVHMPWRRAEAVHACRLSRCTSAITGEDSALPRVKPFKYTYEKEIVMYAYYKKLDYFSTECIYAPHAARGVARELVKELEMVRPSAIVDVIRSVEELRFPESFDAEQKPGKCERCGYMTSQPICKACHLLEGLNSGNPRLGLVKARGRHKAEPEVEHAPALGADQSQHTNRRKPALYGKAVADGETRCSEACACAGKAS